MDLLWLLLLILVIVAALSVFGRGWPARGETVVRRRSPRRRRVVERETIEPTAEGGERRVVEREIPEDRRVRRY